MHRALIAHRVPWVAVLCDAAAAADYGRAAAQAAGMEKAEVVAHFVSHHQIEERTGAIDERPMRAAHVSETGPTAGRQVGEQVDNESRPGGNRVAGLGSG